MIKFFRKIRQKLLSKNKFSKYLIYAIGEIVLVVIGILIALQINNWNENRKEHSIAQQYLKGIEADLKKDILQVNRILDEQLIPINLIHSIDNVYTKEYHQPEKYQAFYNQLDTSKVYTLFNRGYSFRATNGTFNSLISDGKSSIIKNRSFFQQIQEIYTEINLRNTSNYEALKEVENLIRWNYPFEKKNWNYDDLKKAKNEKIFLDLANFTEEKYFYAIGLSLLNKKMKTALQTLEKEIQLNEQF